MYLNTLNAKKLSVRLFLVFSIIVLMYSITFSLRNILRYSSFNKEYKEQLNINIRLEKVNSGYHSLIGFMKSNSFWILEAKKELGYIHSKETVYKFYDEGKL